MIFTANLTLVEHCRFHTVLQIPYCTAIQMYKILSPSYVLSILGLFSGHTGHNLYVLAVHLLYGKTKPILLRYNHLEQSDH